MTTDHTNVARRPVEEDLSVSPRMEDYRVSLARQALTEIHAIMLDSRTNLDSRTGLDPKYWVGRLVVNLQNMVDLADQDDTTARAMSDLFEESARSRDLNVTVVGAAFQRGVEYEQDRHTA